MLTLIKCAVLSQHAEPLGSKLDWLYAVEYTAAFWGPYDLTDGVKNSVACYYTAISCHY